MDKSNYIVPEFGPLRGLRVIGAGSLIAMPFAATMMADFGAEVIQIERPRIGDTYRTFPPFKTTEQGTAGSSWIQDARNRLSMTLELDLSDSDVKEIFYKLIAQSDIFIENMVWLEKLGIDDKELLKINPRLIIVHISGYGHKEFGGKPEICDQASYDMTGQAYSGYALFNGYPEKDPLIVKPSLGDYITALFALFGMLAAYIDAKNTGHGQVVDVAQFESMARVMRDAFTMSSLGLAEVQRCGTNAGQVTAMLLSGVIMSPIIPSSTAKTSMMAPFVNQVCEASGAERNSKQSLGLWFANFMGTNQLGMAFVSGSVYVALMLGFVGESVSWGQWFVRACVWYVVCIILVYVFCLIFCKPTETQKAANVEFIKESYKALGKISTKEKQGIIIVLAALVLWLTQSTHKIDAGMIAILADVAFIACGLITPPEVGAKGMWTITIFVGGVLSVAGLMASLGVSTWLAGILGPILAPIMSSPWIFIPALCIITYLLRFVIVSQSCCMAVMIAIFGSLLEAHGINIFVLVFTSWVSGTCWNVAYQNPASAGLIKMCDPSLDFATASKGSYAYCIINLIAMTCSVPLWMALGLL